MAPPGPAGGADSPNSRARQNQLQTLGSKARPGGAAPPRPSGRIRPRPARHESRPATRSAQKVVKKVVNSTTLALPKWSTWSILGEFSQALPRFFPIKDNNYFRIGALADVVLSAVAGGGAGLARSWRCAPGGIRGDQWANPDLRLSPEAAASSKRRQGGPGWPQVAGRSDL